MGPSCVVTKNNRFITLTRTVKLFRRKNRPRTFQKIWEDSPVGTLRESVRKKKERRGGRGRTHETLGRTHDTATLSFYPFYVVGHQYQISIEVFNSLHFWLEWLSCTIIYFNAACYVLHKIPILKQSLLIDKIKICVTDFSETHFYSQYKHMCFIKLMCLIHYVQLYTITH